MQSTISTQNLVVARYRDGRLVKGVTHDFGPRKTSFHVLSKNTGGKNVSTEIILSELKAAFFVKTLEGKKDHPILKGIWKEKLESVGSTKVKITFFDGELLVGTTQGYASDREGFFVVPMEKDSNNLRVYVISNAVKEIETRK